MWLQKINVKAVPDKYNAGDNADVKEMCINLPIPTNAILHDEVIVNFIWYLFIGARDRKVIESSP